MITLIAHVSDTHFGGPPDARARAEAVVAHLLALDPRPDVLLVSGDIADHGLPEEYAEARAVLDAWPGPKLVGTGNHDVREAFASGMLDVEVVPGPLVQVLEAEDFRILMLDSLVPARDGKRIDHGELSRDQLAWLDEQLGSDDKPAFVSLHHPPADIGLGLMAPILLREPEPLELVDHEAPARDRHPRGPRAHRLRDHVRRPPAAHRRRLRVDGPAGQRALPGGLGGRAAHARLPPAPRRRPAHHALARPAVGRALMLLAFDTATPLVTVALHDGEDVVCELVSERPLQHGEQLAPLIDRALRETGLVRQDLTAIGVGRRPGPVHRPARRSGHRAHPRLRPGDPRLRRLHPRRTGHRGRRHRRGRDGEFVVATDARRKEVYLATYDGDGGRLEGPLVAKPADVATEAPVVGEGAVLYPDAFPHAAGPTMPSAGWLARVIAEERVELHDPEPLYLRRPDAAAPGAPKRVS